MQDLTMPSTPISTPDALKGRRETPAEMVFRVFILDILAFLPRGLNYLNCSMVTRAGFDTALQMFYRYCTDTTFNLLWTTGCDWVRSA